MTHLPLHLSGSPLGSVVPGWPARLSMGLERRGERTVVARLGHEGPLRLQRAFYPDTAGHPHLYLLHPPGGLVPGDSLDIACDLGPAAAALVTTPASAKVYDTGARALEQSQRTTLGLSEGAILEWLPQDSIVFNGARFRSHTLIDASPDARFAVWDIVTLGRAAGAQPFLNGDVVQALTIRRGGRLCFNERIRLDASSPLRHAPWGWMGQNVWGTCVFSLVPDEALREAARELAAQQPGRASVTVVRGLTVGRYLGQEASAALRWFSALWALLRPALVGRPACVPRVWAT
jgi:urease accessory protein